MRRLVSNFPPNFYTFKFPAIFHLSTPSPRPFRPLPPSRPPPYPFRPPHPPLPLLPSFHLPNLGPSTAFRHLGRRHYSTSNRGTSPITSLGAMTTRWHQTLLLLASLFLSQTLHQMKLTMVFPLSCVVLKPIISDFPYFMKVCSSTWFPFGFMTEIRFLKHTR